MANITVAELLVDPDFVDPCTVLRLMERVGQDGIAQRVVVPIQIIASIQSATGDNLLLLPEAARTHGTYECITRFPLNEATDTTAADIVVWQSMQFTVISVGRFGNFANGAGHYEAIMELKPVRTRAQPQTLWVDNASPITWVCNGVPMLWDVPGATPASVTTWDDTSTATPAPVTVWQDETTTTVWDVDT